MRRTVALLVAVAAAAGCDHLWEPLQVDPARLDSAAGTSAAVTFLHDAWGIAYQINERGEVVGEAYLMLIELADVRPFRWTAAEGLRDLGTLGGDAGRANAINSNGEVVGSAEISGFHHAFLWTEAGGMRDLGTLAGGGATAAYAINNLGQVVGTSRSPSGEVRMFLWTEGDGMRDLGVLGGRESAPYAINDNGVVVGTIRGTGTDPSVSEWSSFYWTEAGGVQELGPPGTASVAFGINNAGQVVGGVDPTGGDEFLPALWRLPSMTPACTPVQLRLDPYHHRPFVDLANTAELPVAVLSDANFDARRDLERGRANVRLGEDFMTATGASRTLLLDVDGDGRLDLLGHFSIPRLLRQGNLSAASTAITVLGNLRQPGGRICGTTAIRVTTQSGQH